MALQTGIIASYSKQHHFLKAETGHVALHVQNLGQALPGSDTPRSTAALQQATPSAAAESSIRSAYRIVEFAVMPPGSEPVPLHQAVVQLFPQHFQTVTSAKRACRRGEFLLEGAVCKPQFQR